jgi:diguanylate cyclase (GGDEF)-like protein
MLSIPDVYDEYPNPFFIIRPLINDGVSEDFEYIYVNEAFCIFLGLDKDELVGKYYRDVFHKSGEQVWLKLFTDAAIGKKHLYAENISSIISKKMYTEAFHIEPDLCACIIHDFQGVSNDIATPTTTLSRKANCDYLTGFYNRFYLREVCDKFYHKENIGVTSLDINNLKHINDTLGHVAGDALILQVSTMLRTIYKDSLIFRVGGDEFIIVTTGMDKNKFNQISEDSRQKFRDGNIATIGYSFFEHFVTLKECINKCNALLHEQKVLMKH